MSGVRGVQGVTVVTGEGVVVLGGRIVLFGGGVVNGGGRVVVFILTKADRTEASILPLVNLNCIERCHFKSEI